MDGFARILIFSSQISQIRLATLAEPGEKRRKGKPRQGLGKGKEGEISKTFERRKLPCSQVMTQNVQRGRIWAVERQVYGFPDKIGSSRPWIKICEIFKFLWTEETLKI